jgi:hypothetical protein
MDLAARAALEIICECVNSGRFVMTRHFTERMDQRGLVWPDVLAIIEEPADVRDGGPDNFGRPKWLVSGEASDGLQAEIVCVLDADSAGNTTVLVTIYWD